MKLRRELKLPVGAPVLGLERREIRHKAGPHRTVTVDHTRGGVGARLRAELAARVGPGRQRPVAVLAPPVREGVSVDVFDGAHQSELGGGGRQPVEAPLPRAASVLEHFAPLLALRLGHRAEHVAHRYGPALIEPFALSPGVRDLVSELPNGSVLATAGSI